MESKRYTLSVLVEDEPGVLGRISGLLSRRGFNIESLAVGASEKVDHSRMTMVFNCDDRIIEQVIKQLYKLINVVLVTNVSNVPSLEREIMLMKINTTPETQAEIFEITKVFNIKILDLTFHSMVLEITGDPPKMVAVEKLLSKFGIKEVARTGRIALARDLTYN
jgi:acetolactate synthase-1/3 small subunit|uniref:Acetolactate synthase small subunit n=1 Tax=Pseudopedinella elastica TaxID=35684 RepID=A0A516ZAF5_9STRA|nr:acetolactate synthase 3, small subunit [Pseudopedinella elastica]QDR24697.1 acetolactate synthase 3, small subunit [Pseudopedinella elastica]|tara:strand:+ start:131 stop:625 length:495 start_codon:yes stop_codon:yes gene_type:complete